MTRLLSRIPRPAARPPSPFGPDAIEVGPRAVRIGDGWCASFAIVGYPREVGHGWLEPLTAHPSRLDVALHIEPVPANIAADRLRRQLARLESGRRADAAKGRLGDPDVEVAAEDARELAAGLARGEQKLFRVGLYLTVHARSEKALGAECARVRAVCNSMLLDAQPSTWRTLQGWTSTLPVGVDALGQRRSFDTDALAASFPFASAELSATQRRPLRHRHQRVGAGAVGPLRPGQPQLGHPGPLRCGQVLPGQARSPPLPLPRDRGRGGRPRGRVPPAGRDRRRRLCPSWRPRCPGQPLRPRPGTRRRSPAGRCSSTPSLPCCSAANPTPPRPRRSTGGSSPPTSRSGSPPTPAATPARHPCSATSQPPSSADGDPAARTLAARLAPFTTGTHRGLFDGPTTTRPDGHLIVFSLRDLPGELKAAGTLLTLDAIWRRVSDPANRKRRLVTVDEAWLLMSEPSGAEFLFRMAKSARKHWAGLTVVTQDAGDLLGSPLGQAVIANAATQILLRQAPQSIDTLAEAFGLSAGERAYLLGAARGQGLLAAGVDRVAFTALASAEEDDVCRTGIEQALDDTPDL